MGNGSQDTSMATVGPPAPTPAEPTGPAAPPAPAAATLGPAPVQTDVPTVREQYDFTPGEFAPLAPKAGYYGCIALIPVTSTTLGVALYVSHRTPHGVSWLPPDGTIIVDVPRGFSIDNGNAILDWLKRSAQDGRPPPPGPVLD